MARPPSILVIDDDAYIREALAESFAVAGYDVRTAGDGGEGLAAANSDRPSVLVTDIHMPGIGGAAVIVEFRKRYPDIPVVAISGHFDSGKGLDADGAIALGASRALAKPFTGREVLDAVADVLKSSSN